MATSFDLQLKVESLVAQLVHERRVGDLHLGDLILMALIFEGRDYLTPQQCVRALDERGFRINGDVADFLGGFDEETFRLEQLLEGLACRTVIFDDENLFHGCESSDILASDVSVAKARVRRAPHRSALRVRARRRQCAASRLRRLPGSSL
jgi:hypothetical protein